MLSVDLASSLNEELERLSSESKARATAVALHDVESGWRFSCGATAGFMLQARLKLQCFWRFFGRQTRADSGWMIRCMCEIVFSAQQDGSPFHLSADSDAMPELYQISWTDRENFYARGRNDFFQQQSGDEFAARRFGCGICAASFAGCAGGMAWNCGEALRTMRRTKEEQTTKRPPTGC